MADAPEDVEQSTTEGEEATDPQQEIVDPGQSGDAPDATAEETNQVSQQFLYQSYDKTENVRVYRTFTVFICCILRFKRFRT